MASRRARARLTAEQPRPTTAFARPSERALSTGQRAEAGCSRLQQRLSSPAWPREQPRGTSRSGAEAVAGTSDRAPGVPPSPLSGGPGAHGADRHHLPAHVALLRRPQLRRPLREPAVALIDAGPGLVDASRLPTGRPDDAHISRITPPRHGFNGVWPETLRLDTLRHRGTNRS